MIDFGFGFTDNTPAVQKATDDGSFKNVAHAAAAIRKDAIASIKPGDGPSPPGTPPHTQTSGVSKKGKVKRGKLPRSILFAADKAKGEAVVGPAESIIGEAGAVHEFGGEFEGDNYPERPFMEPALERNLSRFHDSFAATI